MALEHDLLEANKIISFVAVRSCMKLITATHEIILLVSRKSYSNVTLIWKITLHYNNSAPSFPINISMGLLHQLN